MDQRVEYVMEVHVADPLYNCKNLENSTLWTRVEYVYFVDQKVAYVQVVESFHIIKKDWKILPKRL